MLTDRYATPWLFSAESSLFTGFPPQAAANPRSLLRSLFAA